MELLWLLWALLQLLLFLEFAHWDIVYIHAEPSGNT